MVRIAGKAEATSLLAKRTAHCSWWEEARLLMVQRAVSSQTRHDLGSWWGQNQSRPVRVELCWRKAEVMGSEVVAGLEVVAVGW